MGKPYKEDIMTIAQCLEEKGRQEGRNEGVQQGLQKGVELGKMATVKQFLALGIAPEIIGKATGLSLEKL
ncbi:MAG TPA: Yae1 family protein, partial [Opitutales bacterium]|nr:Yae1 family protein [Opitutales bacterium]